MLTGLKWLINAVYDVEPIPSFALFDRQYQYIVAVFYKISIKSNNSCVRNFMFGEKG